MSACSACSEANGSPTLPTPTPTGENENKRLEPKVAEELKENLAAKMEGIKNEKRQVDRRVKQREQTPEAAKPLDPPAPREPADKPKMSSRAAGKAAAQLLLASLATPAGGDPGAGPKAKAKAKAKVAGRAKAAAKGKAKAKAQAAKAKAKNTAKGRKGPKAKAKKSEAWWNQTLSLL